MGKTKTFVVSGNGHFPLDMLRYDCCWPATSIDASVIERMGDLPHGERDVPIGLTTASKNAPTVGRWKSFGWTVSSRG